jgi:hypothetical protein
MYVVVDAILDAAQCLTSTLIVGSRLKIETVIVVKYVRIELGGGRQTGVEDGG